MIVCGFEDVREHKPAVSGKNPVHPVHRCESKIYPCLTMNRFPATRRRRLFQASRAPALPCGSFEETTDHCERIGTWRDSGSYAPFELWCPVPQDWVRAGHHSLVRLPRKLSSRQESEPPRQLGPEIAAEEANPVQKSRKVNTKAKKTPKRKRSGSTALHSSPGGRDRPGESGALGVRSGGKPKEAERAHLRHPMPQLQQLPTGCWSKGWSRRRWRAPTCIGFPSTNCWSPAASRSCWSPGSCATSSKSPGCQALLHSCGLLRGSFRPHEIIVRVRTLPGN